MSDQQPKNRSIELLEAILAEVKFIASIARKHAPPEIASDKDLDSKYGDPEIRFDPKDWTGDSCKGLRMSECPAEFLDMIAETFDYFARKAEDEHEHYNGKPTAPLKRKDAARARGWARRVRAGKGNRRAAETHDDDAPGTW